MALPLGAHSPKLHAVRALRTQQGRREQQRFAVEGATMLAEALEAGLRPYEVFVTQDAAEKHARLLAGLRDRLFVTPDQAMERASDVESPPGLIAVFPTVLSSLDELLQSGEPAIVLAGISDPGNAGTLVRSAEIFGLANAIFGRPGVEPHHPKVVRSTMGAVFRTKLCVSGSEELTLAAQRHGYQIVAAAREGMPLPAFDFPRRALLAVGSERHGVAAWLPRWDAMVSIPQPGRGDSLNAAVAGGIIFYAFSQQFSVPTSDSRIFKKP